MLKIMSRTNGKINGKWLHFCHSFTQSCTHSHPDGSELPHRVLANHQAQFGVQCLAQGHFDMWTGGGDQTANPAISEQLILPPESQPHTHNF